MKGVGLGLAGWTPVTVSHPERLSTIMRCGTEEGWEQLKKNTLSIDAHRKLSAGLADNVRQVRAHFL